MAGEDSDTNPVERVVTPGGMIDVEFARTGEESGVAYLGVFSPDTERYMRIEVGGVANIDDLLGALQRLRARVAKAEGV